MGVGYRSMEARSASTAAGMLAGKDLSTRSEQSRDTCTVIDAHTRATRLMEARSGVLTRRLESPDSSALASRHRMFR